MIDNTKEYIVCAAIKRKTPRTLPNQPSYPINHYELGHRHFDIIWRYRDELDVDEQGFWTSHGRFVDRKEAALIGYRSGQLSYEKVFRKNPDGIEHINDAYSEDFY